jgi:hypothetical protein
MEISLRAHQGVLMWEKDNPSIIDPAPGELIAIFGTRPDVIQSTPKKLGWVSPPLIHIFHLEPPTRFLAQTSGKTKSWGAASNRWLVKQT